MKTLKFISVLILFFITNISASNNEIKSDNKIVEFGIKVSNIKPSLNKFNEGNIWFELADRKFNFENSTTYNISFEFIPINNTRISIGLTFLKYKFNFNWYSHPTQFENYSAEIERFLLPLCIKQYIFEYSKFSIFIRIGYCYNLGSKLDLFMTRKNQFGTFSFRHIGDISSNDFIFNAAFGFRYKMIFIEASYYDEFEKITGYLANYYIPKYTEYTFQLDNFSIGVGIIF